MPWMALAGGAAALGGGIAGALSSSSDRDAASQARQAALQQWLQINVPDPSTQKVILQQYQQQGTLPPQFVQALQQGQSGLSKIAPNSQLQGAQMNALQELQNEGLSGGLTLADQATLQQQNNDTASSARGRNQSIMDEYAKQGLGGSGMQLQAQLQGAQNANQTQAMNSLNAASSSRQRALQAVMGQGQLAGQMANNQYNQQANAAKAQDVINQFNTQNAQGIANQNANWQNQANQYNLGQRQQIANANTDLGNQQQMYNKGLIQQNFNNQMGLAQGKANAQLGAANQYQNQANQTANQWAGVGQGLGQMGMGYAQYQGNQDYNNKQLDAYNNRTDAMSSGGKNPEDDWKYATQGYYGN